MHAVVVKVTVNDFEGGRKMLEEEVVPRVKQAPGFVSGYWTSDGGDGGMSMIVFDTEDNAKGAAEFIQSHAESSDPVTLEDVEVREVVASA